MAQYNYHCPQCAHSFTLEMSYDEFDKARSKKKTCPKCSSKLAVRFNPVAPAVVYKGSGFYSNDNKTGGKK